MGAIHMGHAGLSRHVGGAEMESVMARFFKLNEEQGDMASLKEMREGRGKLERRFQDIVNRAEAADRDVTPEEDAELKQINADDQSLKNRIERQEYLQLHGREMSESKPPGIPLNGLPPGGGRWMKPDGNGGFVEWDGRHESLAVGGGRDLDARAFNSWLRGQAGIQCSRDDEDACQESGRPLHSSAFELNMKPGYPRPGSRSGFQPLNVAHNALTRPTHGYVVPETFIGQVDVAMSGSAPILSLGTVWITATGGPQRNPVVDDTASQAGLIGESQEIGETTMNIGALVRDTRKATSGILRISHQLMRDSDYPLEQLVARVFGDRLGRVVNRYATNGVGGGIEPDGFTVKGTIGKTCAATNAIAPDELIEMANSLDPAYRANAKWMMHPTVAAILQKLKDSENRYLWSNFSEGIVAGPSAKLLGADVVLNTDMPDTLAASNRVIAFGDWSRMMVRLVKGVRFVVAHEKYLEYDEIGLVAHLEFDTWIQNPSQVAAQCPIRLMAMAAA